MTSNAKLFTALLSLSAFLGVAGCADNSGTSCDPPCGASQACCDGVCVFTVSDSLNCGTCGNACASGSCTNGMCSAPVDTGPPPSMCVPECPASLRCCGTTCVERSVAANSDGRSSPSFDNCNGCGIACDSDRALSCSVPGGGEGTPRCMCGDLDQCLPGDVCVNQGGFWTCTSLSTDPQNCGAVGNACAEGESCSGGMCVCGSTGAQCPTGQACCGGACIDTNTDPVNCGGCGVSCTPNAPDCSGGSCTCAASGRACEEPTPGLPIIGGGSPGESCCPSVGCVTNSDTSCACVACSGGDECQVGGSGLFGMLGGGGDEVVTVCCGGSEVALLGCGGFGGIFGDGGLGFPADAGIPLPIDSGSGGMDGGT